MEKKELLEKLLLADEEISMLYHSDEKIRVIIVGGSSFIIKGIIKRQTPDIDTMGLYRQLEPIFNKYEINSNANAYSDNLPYNYEDRLEKVELDTKIVEYFTPSLEDMVIMKLFSSRSKDSKDVENPNVLSQIDWDKLDSLVSSDELDYSFDKERLNIFKHNYENYVKKYKKL